MNVCDLCGFEAKTPQALGAHRALKHGLEGKLAQERTRRASELSAGAVEHAVADLSGKLEAFEQRQTEASEALANATKGLAELIMGMQQTNERLKQLVEAMQQRDKPPADLGANSGSPAQQEVEVDTQREVALFDRNDQVLDDLDCYFGASDMILGERIELVECGDQMCIHILKDPEEIAGYLAKVWPAYSLALDTEGYIWVVQDK